MKRKYFLLIFLGFSSCFSSNLRDALYVSKKYTKEYTGIDTLIQIDGYYYMEDSISIISPFMLSNNRNFQIASGRYGHKNHIQLQKRLEEDLKNHYMEYGNYVLSGDTITAMWASCYDIFWQYSILSERFLIINDTTLKAIWFSWENFKERKESEINEIYFFHKYQFDQDILWKIKK